MQKTVIVFSNYSSQDNIHNIKVDDEFTTNGTQRAYTAYNQSDFAGGSFYNDGVDILIMIF